MIFSLALILGSLTATLAICDIERPPRVGIELSIDYGTVSIVYPNESIITLAEVQANPYYRSLMNGFAETALLTHGPGQTTTKPAEGVFESGIATLSEWAASLALSSRRLWPSERSPVESMLLALLATAEAYLGQKVERATVLTPFSETQDELRMLLDNLLRHKGIEPCTHSDELTPQYVASLFLACGPHGCPLMKIREPILTVEFYGSYLSSSLLTKDYGYMGELRHISNMSLGFESSLQRLDTPNYWRAVKQQLQDTVEWPYVVRSRPIKRAIKHIVLVGDRVHEPHFQALLEDVLGSGTALQKALKAPYDPIFVGSIGAATARCGCPTMTYRDDELDADGDPPVVANDEPDDDDEPEASPLDDIINIYERFMGEL